LRTSTTDQIPPPWGEFVSTSPTYARLLATFMHYPGQVLSRRLLMRQVWETDYTGDPRTLEVHVCWLRKKDRA